MKNDGFKKKILKDGLWSFSSKILIALSGLLLQVLLTRFLTTEGVGNYFIALNTATFLGMVARFGGEYSIVKNFSESFATENYRELLVRFNKQFKFVGFTSLIVAITYFFINDALSIHLFNTIDLIGKGYLIAIWIFLISFLILISEGFRGIHNIKTASYFEIGTTTLLTCIFILLSMIIYNTGNLSTVLEFAILSYLIICSVGFLLLRKNIKKLAETNSKDVRQSRSVNKSFNSDSWPFLIRTIAAFILTQSDIWILASYLDQKQVAFYGVASRLVILTGFMLRLVNNVISPNIPALLIKNERIKLEKVLTTATAAAAIPGFIILISYIFLGKWLLTTFFGINYIAAYPILVTLSIGRIFNVITGPCGNVLLLSGHQARVMVQVIISSLLAVILSLVLVRYYEAIGVAFSFATAMAFQQTSLFIMAKRYAGVWTYPSFTRFFNEIKLIMK